MKRQIYLYLFLITALILLFVIVNGKKETKSYEDKILKLEQIVDQKEEKYQDTIENLRIENLELSGFSLKEDAYAIEYLYKEGYDYKELISHIEDQLISLNTATEEGNPLVPYAPMMGDRMLINDLKMLNHKWVVANFTDGVFWGQVLLECTYNEDKSIKFSEVRSFLYPEDVTK